MSLQEAREFVAHFIAGEYTPEEYAAFLQWIKAATVEELTIIANTHESMHSGWVLPEGPTAEWVMQLERKLDVAAVEVREDEAATVMGNREMEEIRGWQEEERGAEEKEVNVPVIPMAPVKRTRLNIWTAAASVVVLSTGTFIYVQQMQSRPAEQSNRDKFLSKVFSNPKGGAQQEMTLEDGSKIWLNAGSELKYPPRFSGSERLVELSGEAFFDVAGNSGRPFRVLIKDAEVEVLGTYFNIMAYEDEPVSRTTLVDGAVRVTSGQQRKVLKPGDRAELTYSSPGVGATLAVNPGVNLQAVLDWKKGIYHFESADLPSIMRELERVYDVRIKYQDGMTYPTPNNGSLDLRKGLATALKQLQESYLNRIHFSSNGKTVIVSSI